MKKFIATLVSFAPAIASAQVITDVNSLSVKLVNLGNVFLEILIGFAVLYIIFQVIRFIMKAESPDDRKAIGAAILWGIVGLFLIISIWGLVRILTNTFRTDRTMPTHDLPVIPYTNTAP